mgnify:CR=1 FL=1
MKILFISMPSIHVVRWIENLKDTSFELYWYDILNRGKLETLETVTQYINNSERKILHLKGKYWLSKKLPRFYNSIRPFLEQTENEVLERIIERIKPDIIHSFELYSSAYPILKTMNRYPEIKWLYSCWGNDIYYYSKFYNHKDEIRSVLKRVNFLHTDCFRDYQIANELGFTGKHLGVIPGGSGYKLEEVEKYKQSTDSRKIILVKGYQNVFGRALYVIKALEKLKIKTDHYEVIIFGGHQEVKNYIDNNNLNYKVYGRNELSHQQVIELMGKSLLYIGNNISDGMANTLLEAIIMGAFPIQSNPGNVSAEIIEHGKNGLLINDPEDINNISELIVEALENFDMLENACELNKKIAARKLDYYINQKKIIEMYETIENT